MKNSDEKQNNWLNVISWLGIVLITVCAFICTYYYTFSGPILSIIWFGWFVVAVLLGYLTTLGKKAYEFALEAKVELLKVVWPTRHETIQTTMVVMSMVAITGFILWGIDSLMMWTIAKITHLG